MPSGSRRGVTFLVGLTFLLTGSSVPTTPAAPAEAWWLEGSPLNLDMEADPWVRAVRAAQIEHVAAVNAADFSSYRLRRAWPEAEVRRLVEESRRALRDGTAEAYIGPMPFAPVHVEVSDDGRQAVVYGCADRPTRLQEQVTADAQDWPTPATFTLERFDDGFRRVIDTTVGPLTEPLTLPAGRYSDGDAVLTAQWCKGLLRIPVAAVHPVPDFYGLTRKAPDDVVLPPMTSWG